MSYPHPSAEPYIRNKEAKESAASSHHTIVAMSFIADMVVIFYSLFLAYFIRFHTGLAEIGVPDLNALRASDYVGHFAIGVLIMMGILGNLRFYERRSFLSFDRTLSLIWKSALIWGVVFTALSLILKFTPSISRMYCGIAMVTLMVTLPAWRGILWKILQREELAAIMKERALVVGWSPECNKGVELADRSEMSRLAIAGVIPPPSGEFDAALPDKVRVIGRYCDFETLVKMKICDVVLVADYGMTRDDLMRLTQICEKEMVDFKIVPTCFRILLSGLHLETINGMPVLGISKLPLHSTVNQFLKRFVDVWGALFGLTIFAPVILLFGILIYRESPGPIFYRQRRLGMNGKLFDMIKLRSMRLDAEKDGKVGWTVKDDPRRLRIGTFMRKWNIDEVPQFWNVLKGEMSLVGPRPERPELIEDFKEVIPHYNARHNIKPGITGWAQVNGLRGDTDLEERVQFDLHYIENWNVMFDFQIMVMTFLKHENAC